MRNLYPIEQNAQAIPTTLSVVAAVETLPSCPWCHTPTSVRVTLMSDVGRYCLCDRCGMLWHHKDDAPKPPPDPSPDNDTNA